MTRSYSPILSGLLFRKKNLYFVGEEVKGYLPTMVREFYSNLREGHNVDTLLETTILEKQLRVSPDSIAQSLNYVCLATHERPYPLKAITEFDARFFADAMCTNPVTMGGFVRKEFIPGKLKP